MTRVDDGLRRRIGPEGLIDHSCTAALEMAVIVAGIEAADEAIMSLFTFPRPRTPWRPPRGAPGFVHIADEYAEPRSPKPAITPRSKAVCVVADYDGLRRDGRDPRDRRGIIGRVLIEDAADAVLARHRVRPGGYARRDLLCRSSFHELRHGGRSRRARFMDPDPAERAFRSWEHAPTGVRSNAGQVDRASWEDIAVPRPAE